MNNQTPITQAFGPTINRIADVMEHSIKYSFWGVTRLAEDAQVTASAISRLINGKMNPSWTMVERIAAVLTRDFGFRLDPADLIAENGLFLTRHACDLVRCKGCLPKRAFDEFGDLKAAFVGIEQGHWVTSRYPRGLDSSLRGGL